MKPSRAKAAQMAGMVFSGVTIKEAGPSLGLSEPQAYRLARSQTFKDALEEMRKDALQTTMATLSKHSRLATACLIQIMSDRMATDSARVSAASKILDAMIKVSEFADIEERLSALEAQVDTAEFQQK